MTKNEYYEQLKQANLPKTIAIIMDGNGRWAQKRGLKRVDGHTKGVKTLVEIVDACCKLGISNLVAFAFSTENWTRPQEEVDFLMKTCLTSLDFYLPKMQKKNIRLRVIGETNHLSEQLKKKIHESEKISQNNTGLTLYLAFNYGGKKELISVCKEISQETLENKITIDAIDEEMIEKHLYTADMPPVDFLIRTSGEMRISNFMLWQIAYSELYFPKTYWPDFHELEFYKALMVYLSRKRRYGGLKN